MFNGRYPMIKGNYVHRRRGGFTLIEVLASMAVLLVLILALTRMFVEAANITQRGITALTRNSAGETALETLLQDTEGMAVNERLACYVEANKVDPDGFGFDETWFITTSGDQDDGRAYQLMRYYVKESIATNSLGVAYTRFRLYRDLWIMAVADSYVGDIMSMDLNPANNIPLREWWEHGLETITTPPWPIADRNMLADNVVRFDIYCLGWDGEDWMQEVMGERVFNSTIGPVGFPQYADMPPAAFDIYLQITSPDAAVEGGMMLLPGMDEATKTRARDLMIQESSTLLGRASPIIGAAQYHHPVSHYTE